MVARAVPAVCLASGRPAATGCQSGSGRGCDGHDLALTLARRELRGGVRGLWIVLLCLALGVGVIAAVGTLRAAVDAGLAADGRALLGGDLEIDGGSQPLPDAAARLAARPWRHDLRRDADALDAGCPVRRAAADRAESRRRELAAGRPAPRPNPRQPHRRTRLGQQDGHYGLLAEQVVLDRLGLHPGDTARLGTATFRVAGALTARARPGRRPPPSWARAC